MRFSDIPGREEVKDRLREMVGTGRIPHALMISGPAGTGKMMMARAFMQYVHCLNPVDGEPCGKCTQCKMHQELANPDVHFTYPIVKSKARKILESDDCQEEWHRMLAEAPAMPQEHWLDIIEAGNSQPAIHVEEAERIVELSNFPPYSAKVKFFCIWLPEKLNIAAANKLLKLIEEPSPGICFLMVCDNELELLPTIYSRTQRIQMGPADRESMELYLRQRWHLDEQSAFKFAPLTRGSIARADELGSDSSEQDAFRDLFQQIMRNAYSRRVGALRTIADSMAAFGREKLIRFFTYMAAQIRENFIFNLRMPPLNVLTPEEEAFSRNFAPFVNAANVEDISEAIDEARIDIEKNCNSKLVIFDFFMILIPAIRRKCE